MGLHKLVNGIRIELSQEEEKKFIDDWENNEKKEIENKKKYDRKLNMPSLNLQLQMIYDDLHSDLPLKNGSWYKMMEEFNSKYPKIKD